MSLANLHMFITLIQSNAKLIGRNGWTDWSNIRHNLLMIHRPCIVGRDSFSLSFIGKVTLIVLFGDYWAACTVSRFYHFYFFIETEGN